MYRTCHVCVFFLPTATTHGGSCERGVTAMAQNLTSRTFKRSQLCPGSCVRGLVSLHVRNVNSLSAALITQERMCQFLVFQKLWAKRKKKKPKQSSISAWGPLMYHERLRLLSLHLIRCLYSSRVRKPVMGKLQKGETGRAPGPSEVLSKAFPFYALSRRYSSCQLIFILAKTWGLKRTFQLLRHTLQQDWVFFWKDREGGEEKKSKNKKRETTWNNRNGKDFQTERHGKESDSAFGEMGRRWIWHCAPLKRGTRHIQDLLILASRFVCSSRKSIWHITINMYRGFLYILSQVCPALWAKINETDREKVPRSFVCACVSFVRQPQPISRQHFSSQLSSLGGTWKEKV